MSAGRHTSYAFGLLSVVVPTVSEYLQCSPTAIGTFFYFPSATVCLNRQLFLRPLSLCRISCTHLVNVEKKVSCTSFANGQTPCFLYLSRKGRDIRFPVLVSQNARRLDRCFIRPHFLPQRGHNASNIEISDVNEMCVIFVRFQQKTYRQILAKIQHTKYHENPPSGRCVVPCGLMDKRRGYRPLLALRTRLKSSN